MEIGSRKLEQLRVENAMQSNFDDKCMYVRTCIHISARVSKILGSEGLLGQEINYKVIHDTHIVYFISPHLPFRLCWEKVLCVVWSKRRW